MKHYRLPAKQQGMGKWSWLFVIIVFISAGTVALKLGPHYVDFEMVKGVIDRLPAEDVPEMKRSEIRDHFARQFRVENFGHTVKDIVDVKREDDTTIVTVSYEVREHIAYNVDVVLRFSESRSYK